MGDAEDLAAEVVVEDQPEAPGEAQLPAIEDEARGDATGWTRWKGSVQDIARIFRVAHELIEKTVDDETPDYSRYQSIRLDLPGRERTFRKIEDFETHLGEIEIADVQGVSFSSATAKVNAMVSFDRDIGAYVSVRGKDQFAVAGVERELKSQLEKGRRWTQVVGRWPGHLSFWAPWVAIFGLGFSDLVGGAAGRTIGLALVAVGFLMLSVVLFMQYVEPKLVPPLELLGESEERTVSQVWASRGLKAGAIAAAAIAGAMINGLTGFLF
jgi:hypothetical protein